MDRFATLVRHGGWRPENGCSARLARYPGSGRADAFALAPAASAMLVAAAEVLSGDSTMASPSYSPSMK